MLCVMNAALSVPLCLCCASVPQLRTIYRRTAFQRDDSNAVRISLDTSLQMFREEPYIVGRDSLAAARAAMDRLGASDTELNDPDRS